MKLYRRVGYLFPDRPEALALAVVAVGGIGEKDLGEAAWPCFIARACGDGEGEGVKTKGPRGSLGRTTVQELLGGPKDDGWPLLWGEPPPQVSFSLRPFASL